MPGGGGGPGGRPRFVQPPLAYFQPGILRGGRFIEAAEVVFNWRPGMGGVDPKWNTAIGSDAFDPQEVAMHELGHAIRFLHDDVLFDDDITVFPTGSMPGANVTILTSGRDRMLQTVRLPDDVMACGDINAGANGVADSGKKTNVMETFAVKGRHGINPGAGVPAGSSYRFTDREQQTGLAAKIHIPPKPMPPAGGRGMQIAAGNGRTQQWSSLALLGDMGVTTYSPGLVANDETTDFIVDSIPPASSFRGSLLASSPALAGTTKVEIFAELGTASPDTTARVQVWIPFSPSNPYLEVHANWMSDQVWITDGATVLCDGALSGFHPVDCWINPAGPEFHSVGIVVVDLTTATNCSSTSPKP
jgi:hypothetical protein